RIDSVGVLLGVVTLAADGLRQLTARIRVRAQTGNDMGEVVARLPAELFTGAGVHVHALDVRKHAPPSAPVFVYVVGYVARDHARCVAPQFEQVIAREGRGGAENVAAKTDFR